MIKGGTKWQKEVGWSEAVHPWMSGYCGFFALALNRQFRETSLAVECFEGHFAHALVHVGDQFFDARGRLDNYQDGRVILTNLNEVDLRATGLLSPKPGVRDVDEEAVLNYANAWLKETNYLSPCLISEMT